MPIEFSISRPEDVLWEMFKAAMMNEVADNRDVRDEFTVLYEELLELIKRRAG